MSLWFARGYVVARLREIFGEGRKATDGGDLYDNIYFEDAAYSDVFVTGDEALARRGRSLRLTSPRILLTEEWVTLLGRRGQRRPADTRQHLLDPGEQVADLALALSLEARLLLHRHDALPGRRLQKERRDARSDLSTASSPLVVLRHGWIGRREVLFADAPSDDGVTEDRARPLPESVEHEVLGLPVAVMGDDEIRLALPAPTCRPTRPVSAPRDSATSSRSPR